MEIGSVVRHIAQFVAGYLTSKGVIESSLEETVIGVIVGVAALGWYFYNKSKAA